MSNGSMTVRPEGGSISNDTIFSMPRQELRATFTDAEQELADSMMRLEAKDNKQTAETWWNRGKLLHLALVEAAKKKNEGRSKKNQVVRAYGEKIVERVSAWIGKKGPDHLKNCLAIYRRWTNKRMFDKFAGQRSDEGVTLQPTHLYHLACIESDEKRLVWAGKVLDEDWSTMTLAAKIAAARREGDEDAPETEKPMTMTGYFSKLTGAAKNAVNKFSGIIEDLNFEKAIENMPSDELISQGYLDRVNNVDSTLEQAEQYFANLRRQLSTCRDHIEEVYEANNVGGNGSATPAIEGPPAPESDWEEVDDAEWEEVDDDDDDSDEFESIADIRKRQRKAAEAKKKAAPKKAPVKKRAKKRPAKKATTRK